MRLNPRTLRHDAACDINGTRSPCAIFGLAKNARATAKGPYRAPMRRFKIGSVEGSWPEAWV